MELVNDGVMDHPFTFMSTPFQVISPQRHSGTLIGPGKMWWLVRKAGEIRRGSAHRLTISTDLTVSTAYSLSRGTG